MLFFGSRVQQLPAVDAPPLVPPRPSVDGWTLERTPLVRRLNGRLNRVEQRDLANQLHLVTVGAGHPHAYRRAMALLEEAGVLDQAWAVCHAWAALPDDVRRAHASDTRFFARRADRYHLRLSTPVELPGQRAAS